MRYYNIISIALFLIASLIVVKPSMAQQETTVTTMQAATGCTITKQALPRQATTTLSPRVNGSIATIWTSRDTQNPSWGNQEVKAWIAPGQSTWTIYDASVTLWTSDNCTTNQLYNEFQKNILPARTWGELCTAKITCAPATTVPTPTPGNTACQQLQVETLQRGNHTIQPSSSGKILLLWTNRGAQNPSWGAADVKVWMPPGQPAWQLYDTGGTVLSAPGCTTNQLYTRFQQENKQTVTWSQLCSARMTCTPTSPSPTPGNPQVAFCTDIKAQTLAIGNHTLPAPNSGGAILTVWSGKNTVSWGGAEKKTFLNPGEQWQLYQSGGTLWTSEHCSFAQMRESFRQNQLEEKSWSALCGAKITCQ